MTDNYISIPEWHITDPDGIELKENGDSLINIAFKNPRIISEPCYYNRGIRGAIKECYIRQSVYELLLKALGFLPEGYGFKIYDSWRPYEVQRFLYDEQVEKLCRQGYTIEKAKQEAKEFVSYPEKDPMKPYVHSTGGAVDLTVIDEKGNELPMGTDFDDFTSLAYTDAFESGEDETVKNNRRLLYNAMIKTGFTNYPSEWWHYDYGDFFWAAETKRKISLFGGIYETSEGKQA